MTLWILDTDHLSLLQRGHPLVRQRLQLVNPEDIAITIVTFEEQMYGRLKSIRQARSADQLVVSYGRLLETFNDLQSINILPFDTASNSIFSELVRQKIRIGTMDLRIAAITISVQGILVTRNRRDFAQIPNLTIEDWSLD
jgi:tRNA(fMet)-specific endonuclease VapC